MKPAVTDLLAFIVTVQLVSATLSQPLQPVNTELDAASAVSVTVAPLEYDAEQSAPQAIPCGAEVTVPAPSPVVATVSVTGGVIVRAKTPSP